MGGPYQVKAYISLQHDLVHGDGPHKQDFFSLHVFFESTTNQITRHAFRNSVCNFLGQIRRKKTQQQPIDVNHAQEGISHKRAVQLREFASDQDLAGGIVEGCSDAEAQVVRCDSNHAATCVACLHMSHHKFIISHGLHPLGLDSSVSMLRNWKCLNGLHLHLLSTALATGSEPCGSDPQAFGFAVFHMAFMDNSFFAQEHCRK
jgi:hypothetical protein